NNTSQNQNNNNENNNNSNFQISSENNAQKKSISEVITAIHKELKTTNERMSELISDVKNIENTVNTLGHRVDELEENKKITDEKFSSMDENLSKFLSLYELVNNQYNPFVEEEKIKEINVQKILVNNDGSNEINTENFNKTNSENKTIKTIDFKNDKDTSLLELDTLNIEEAAGNAVPLTHLKNNTNSLVTILSWLEYLINREGIEETRNTLRYYTEVLRWITPEVFFDLDKYLRGMKDKKDLKGDEKLDVKDHIVSLYFISKLNEKNLDDAKVEISKLIENIEKKNFIANPNSFNCKFCDYNDLCPYSKEKSL
ncbi:hypothetical protein EOM09_09035, partial [bacterium]|nr:hypothetical protein [bacterium]